MQLHPATEKVPARRGVPVIVGVVAIAFVALLVAKPWDPRPAPAGSAAPPSAVAAVTPTDATTAPTVTAEPTLTPTSQPTPVATPDIAPIGPLGEIALPYTPGEAMAQCDYGRLRNGGRRLTSITVQPPTVLLDAGSSISDIRRVGWWLELEKNRADDIFEREWQMVGRSRAQVAGITLGQVTRFAPMTVQNSERSTDLDVYRVRMVVEWYTRNLEVAGRVTIVANHYQEGEFRRVGGYPPLCRGVVSGITA